MTARPDWLPDPTAPWAHDPDPEAAAEAANTGPSTVETALAAALAGTDSPVETRLTAALDALDDPQPRP